MGTNLIRAALLASASVAVATAALPTAAYAQEASYQFDIPAQSMADALRALGRATKQNVVFDGSVVRGKRSVAVRGRMSAGAALQKMLAGSGLVMTRGAGGALMVQGGNGDTGPARASGEASAGSSVTAPAGAVVDARTGAALKGALIEIVETGEQTSTGDLGEFRFPGRTGSFNLRISYLGYPEYEQYVELKNGRATSGILLSDGSAVGEIVVTAYQSARAQALNQERTADNASTVISSDLLGNFDGTTVSESLRRASGIAFQPSSETGDGANVIVRGLAPDFNAVTFNGLKLPVGNGADRSPALNNILTDSISEIKINKSLLPSHISAGTGGLIEIETKGPLDRPDFYLNAGIEHSLSAKEFLKETLASGTVSVRLGSEKQFGISASVQYRKRKITTIGYSSQLNFGQYRPLNEAGQPAFSLNEVDPSRRFPFDPDATDVYTQQVSNDYNGTDLSDFVITASAQWKIADHTNLRLDLNRAEQKRDSFTRSQSIISGGGYELMPISDLGGSQRYGLVWEDYQGTPGSKLFSNQLYNWSNNQKDITSTLAFRGDSHFGKVDLNYKLGIASGKSPRPEQYSLSTFLRPGGMVDTSGRLNVPDAFLSDAALSNTLMGRMISPFALREPGKRGYPLPFLNDAGFAFFNDPANYYVSDGSITAGTGKNSRRTGEFSARYNVSSPFLKYLEAGVYFEQSKAVSISGSRFDYITAPTSPSLADLGFRFSQASLAAIGLDSGFDVVRQGDIEQFFAALRDASVDGIELVPIDVDPASFDALTRERELAGYVQANATIGKLDIIGGVRVEKTSLLARNTFSPFIYDQNFVFDQQYYQDNRGLVDLTDSATTVLPRVTLNLRPDEKTVLRAGFFTTIARPSLIQLNAPATFILYQAPFFGPDGNQPALFAYVGNPDLKPATTSNFDISLERYDDNVGAIKLGLFYKKTKNLLFDNVAEGLTAIDGIDLPDDPRFQTLPANIFISGSRPQNNPNKAHIWGIETSVEKKLRFLPGFLGNLGVYANYTYTHASKDEIVSYVGGLAVVRDQPYPSQPKHSGTAAVTYSDKSLSASLSYSAQSRYRTAFAGYGLSQYQERISSLDLKTSYRLPTALGDFTFFFEGSDLLKGPSNPDIERSVGGYGGTDKYYTGGIFIGGRSFRLGVSATF